jgi:hypothetical protein
LKSIIRIIVLIPFLLLLTSCNKTESPTESVSINKGEYTGIFSVTFKNYKNNSSPLTQEGTISIIFSDSSYEYSAKADYSSSEIADTFLTDRGRYSWTENKIIMNDISWEMMDPRWHNSLYLLNTFTIQAIGNQLEISQDNSFASWKINLITKK